MPNIDPSSHGEDPLENETKKKEELNERATTLMIE